jgi:hypothetical protein
MKTSLARTNAIVSHKAANDLTGKVGHFTLITTAQLIELWSENNICFGVLMTDGKAGERVTIALSAGGLAGTVRVKLAAPVTYPSQFLQITPDGRVVPDTGSGERLLVAQALETGAIDELIEAVLFRPVALG